MNTNKPPSLLKILQTDYYTFLSFLFLLILWIVYALFQIFDFESPPGAIYVAVALSTFSLAIMVWRYQIIQALFSNGTLVSATVTDLWFYRGRGRIDFAFNFRGHEYLSGNDVVPSINTRAMRVGDRINVLIDPENPLRAIIQVLYQ
jgi:hypothetical protein